MSAAACEPTGEPALPPVSAEEWDETIEAAARLGFILTITEGDDGRWSASFERLDDNYVQVFSAASAHRLHKQLEMILLIARSAIRGAFRRVRDRG